MRFLIVLLLIAAAWGGYRHFNPPYATTAATLAATSARQPVTPERLQPKAAQNLSCDGSQHCSQMRSCEEATFFIRNCPDTGHSDGVPCESQWYG
ncbi:excalibur calcium-binding domain-containing protein [Luteimonas sp. 3794]|uniref:excalibur calcium-binding domain-containing protein n=1 Tax=Luteimonas sp. 3794 TaxID=2817730 RepID=UPI0028608E69|nr:excalibur calcium-binding domain-containing protein [Luteimonas sp. 3794]MDR6990299.1 hypothetical protein [Luteimonas sp. 3794]